MTNFPVKKCALRLFYMKLECCFSSEVNRKDSEPNKAGSAHFGEEDKDRTSLSCTRIHEGAVPSIFLNSVKVTELVNVKRKLKLPFIASPVRISIVTEKKLKHSVMLCKTKCSLITQNKKGQTFAVN